VSLPEAAWASGEQKDMPDSREIQPILSANGETTDEPLYNSEIFRGSLEDC
jgi:hypothetical protein